MLYKYIGGARNLDVLAGDGESALEALDRFWRHAVLLLGSVSWFGFRPKGVPRPKENAHHPRTPLEP